MEEIFNKILNQKKEIIKCSVFFGLTILFFCLLPTVSLAATLNLSPATGSYTIGNAFSVNVYVSSADQAMNAAAGVISFPKDKLEVTSLSKNGSIFNFWVKEPAFSNTAGNISFEGIVLNPGFTGNSGRIITISFRAKSAGTALLNFTSGSTLANDGKGTNILSSLGKAQFNLGETAPPPFEAPATTPEKVSTSETKTPATYQVTSPTHPDSDEWYSNKNPKFAWTLPSGVSGASVYFSQSPTSNPGPVSDGLFNSKSYENVADGVWYFHIKMRNAAGWGPIAHFKIQIDSQPPEPFKIKLIDGAETENPKPTVIFDTTDSLSGIKEYKIKISNNDSFSVIPEAVAKAPYTLPLQNPGKKNILIQAFDNAGNFSTAMEEFTIKPLQTPTFIDYPRSLTSDSVLKINGESRYPNAQITVWLQKNKDDAKSAVVKSDQDGNFTFVADEKLADGIYKLWAVLADGRGAKSLPTEKITIIVSQSAFLRAGTLAVGFLSVVVPLIALILVLLFIIFYGWHQFSVFRKKVKKEVREAEMALHQAFELLKKDIQAQIKMLEKIRNKRDLTMEEEKVIKQLKKDLDNAEKLIIKEIDDINIK